MARFTKSEGPHEQPSRISWSRSNGYETVREWEGSRRAIHGFIPALLSGEGPESFEIVEEGPTARLIANFGSAQDQSIETPQSLWELVGNDLEKDIKQLAVIQQNVTKEELAAIESAIADDENDYTFSPKTPQGEALFVLIRRGTEAFSVSQFVLRHTLSFSSRFDYSANIAPAFNGLGRAWSTGQIFAFHPDIPATLQASISLIQAQAAPDHNWGWLKRTPTISEIGGGRFQSSQEWWIELWSEFIYPAQP